MVTHVTHRNNPAMALLSISIKFNNVAVVPTGDVNAICSEGCFRFPCTYIKAQIYVSAGDGRMRVSEAQPEVRNLKGPDLCQSMRDMF